MDGGSTRMGIKKGVESLWKVRMGMRIALRA